MPKGQHAGMHAAIAVVLLSLSPSMALDRVSLPSPVSLALLGREHVKHQRGRMLRSLTATPQIADQTASSIAPCVPLDPPHQWNSTDNNGITSLENVQAFVCVSSSVSPGATAVTAAGDVGGGHVCSAVEPCWIDGILAIYYPFSGTTINQLRKLLPVSPFHSITAVLAHSYIIPALLQVLDPETGCLPQQVLEHER